MDNSQYTFETESERIEKQIEHTKISLAEKVEELQSEVSNTFQGAETSVRDTVAEVKRAFSFDHQMQKNPVIFVTGSLVVGLLVGRMLRSSGIKKERKETPELRQSSEQPTLAQPKSAFADMTDSLMADIVNLKTLAVGTLFATLREVAQSSAPGYFAKSIGNFFDSATEQWGGKVIEEQSNGYSGGKEL